MERFTVRNSEGIGVLKQPFECERCGDLQWSLPDLGNGSPIDKLAEYEDLEEQGKLLRLPCTDAINDLVSTLKELSEADGDTSQKEVCEFILSYMKQVGLIGGSVEVVCGEVERGKRE